VLRATGGLGDYETVGTGNVERWGGGRAVAAGRASVAEPGQEWVVVSVVGSTDAAKGVALDVRDAGGVRAHTFDINPRW